MWTSTTMDAGTAVMVSIMGIAVVFLSLIALAVAIIIVSKIVNSTQKNRETVPSVPSAPSAPSTSSAPIASSADDETYAVLMAAACEEAHASPDTIQIKEIKEIK
jgi:sodium pump decarboxylase gamma subunit